MVKSESRGSLGCRDAIRLNKLCCFTEIFACSLQIDFDDVAAINPELLQLLPLHPKDNLPLQENVTVQVGAFIWLHPVLQRSHLACWLFAGLISGTA